MRALVWKECHENLRWAAVPFLVLGGLLAVVGPPALMNYEALLVLGLFANVSGAALGFLQDTWLGALVGAALYIGSRLFAPAEETELAERFGPQWDAYRRSVRIRWL